MIKIEIPYRSHSNKPLWDYITNICGQINNINLADNLNSPEADFDNVVYFLFSGNTVYALVSLSQKISDNLYKSYCDVWVKLLDLNFDFGNKISIYSFDIKKYNSVTAITEDYKSRDKIRFMLDENTSKLYYTVLEDDNTDLSPVIITQELYEKIYSSFTSYQLQKVSNKFKRKNEGTTACLRVSSVDKNSFLLPYMAYKDFLNFATYSSNNTSYIIKDENNNLSFINTLIDSEDLLFYSDTKLRQDKFELIGSSKIVPSSLWQILVTLQHYKQWQKLEYYVDNKTADLIFDSKNTENSIATHVMTYYGDSFEIQNIDLQNFKLVGKIHSNELFKLNKLFSNANRTCYFDFSTQTFTGNNYVFNDEKLDIKTVGLTNKINAELPLKITFTEIKHYVGSDLSQKNFMLKLYTDGIRVMLERWVDDETNMECRVLFNHTMSKKNQNLTV